jgi:hypothetical protein
MRRHPVILCSALALALAAAACAPTIVDPYANAPSPQSGDTGTSSSTGGGSSTVSTTPGTSSTSSGSSDVNAVNAIAIPFKDLPTTGAPIGGPIGQGAESSPDPDALVLLWSNDPISCPAPYMTQGSFSWEGAIVLPPDLLSAGAIPASDAGLLGYTYQWMEDPGSSGGGGGGGGPLQNVSIQIVSIDATSITVTIGPWSVVPDAITVSGTYKIPRC